MSAVFIGAGTAIVGLGITAGNAISQKHKANEIKKNLKDPIYNIPQEFYQNRDIAKQMAQVGLPQAQYNNQLNNIQQNQAGSIVALGSSANPGANLAAVVRQGDAATGNLNAQDAAARQNNQRYFLAQNSALGNQRLQKQQNDVFDKYTREFNQMQAYNGAAAQGFNNVANGAMQLGMSTANYGANGGFGNTASTGATPNLQPGTAQSMQIPQQFWQTSGLGYQDPNINKFNYGAQWGYPGIFNK